MYCRNCGKEITENSVGLCTNCGKMSNDGESYCPNCGNTTQKGQVMCTYCGFIVAPEKIKARMESPKSENASIDNAINKTKSIVNKINSTSDEKKLYFLRLGICIGTMLTFLLFVYLPIFKCKLTYSMLEDYGLLDSYKVNNLSDFGNLLNGDPIEYNLSLAQIFNNDNFFGIMFLIISIILLLPTVKRFLSLLINYKNAEKAINIILAKDLEYNFFCKGDVVRIVILVMIAFSFINTAKTFVIGFSYVLIIFVTLLIIGIGYCGFIASKKEPEFFLNLSEEKQEEFLSELSYNDRIAAEKILYK